MSLGSLFALLSTSSGTVIALIIAILGVYFIWRSLQSRGMPPGPPSLPLIGSLLSLLGGDVREELCRLARHYGDVFTMDMGMNRTVMLASYDAIKEALVTNAQALSGRPQDVFMTNELTQGKGIGASEGPLWREHRKFVHGVFRDFGVGRPVFEEKIQQEISFLLQFFRDNTERPFDPASIIQKAVSNVINSVTLGQRYEYLDPLFLRHLDILEKNFRALSNSGALVIFPFLRHLPGDLFEFKRMKRDLKGVFDDYTDIIHEHRESRTPGVIRDVIDAYMEEAERQKDNKDSTFTDSQLQMIISDLFATGTETTATTLRWALAYLLHNPDIMQRAQREIEEVLGPSRMPSMKDKPHMPYTGAVLAEVQRMADIAPLGVPHANTEDVWLRGYRIPKGTHIFPVLYAAHRDPNIWREPYRFNPERFLDAEGQFVKNEHLIAFSMGRRVCLGESLARMELFLFFVALLQHFNFRAPPGVSLPSLKGHLGITYIPQPFKVVIELKS